MNKEDIVVGGIYAFKDPECDVIEAAIVVEIVECLKAVCLIPNPRCVKYSVSSRLRHEIDLPYFIEQIGYDTTYSDEWKVIKQNYDDACKAINACDVLLDYEKDHSPNDTERYEQVQDLQEHYEAVMGLALGKLNVIKIQKSWMKGDSDE